MRVSIKGRKICQAYFFCRMCITKKYWAHTHTKWSAWSKSHYAGRKNFLLKKNMILHIYSLSLALSLSSNFIRYIVFFMNFLQSRYDRMWMWILTVDSIDLWRYQGRENASCSYLWKAFFSTTPNLCISLCMYVYC